jgi:hypothetical protein
MTLTLPGLIVLISQSALSQSRSVTNRPCALTTPPGSDSFSIEASTQRLSTLQTRATKPLFGIWPSRTDTLLPLHGRGHALEGVSSARLPEPGSDGTPKIGTRRLRRL